MFSNLVACGLKVRSDTDRVVKFPLQRSLASFPKHELENFFSVFIKVFGPSLRIESGKKFCGYAYA